MGRPRIIGERLPTLLERLADPTTPWQRFHVSGLVRRRRAPGRNHLRHGDLASSGQARPDPLCSGARCRRCVQTSGVPVHGPAGRSARYPALVDILRWFIRRWATEVTFAEVRRHLGVETQRQWSDKAIARTTPALLGLFSLVTLWTSDPGVRRLARPRGAAWYQKGDLTFSDALAAVRRSLWAAALSACHVRPPTSRKWKLPFSTA